MARDVAVRNALAFAVPELLWGFGWGLAIDNPMPAAFADGFGSSEGLVGSFGLCAAIGLGIPMLFTEYLLAPWRRKRGLVFWGHIAPGLALGLLAMLIPHAAKHSIAAVEALYLSAFLLFWLSIGVIVPAWLSLMGDLFPDRQRTRILGITFSANRLAGFAGGTVAERVLSMSDLSPADQWQLLFGLAAVVMLFGSIPFLFIIEEPRTPQPRPPVRTYLGGVWRLFKELRTLRRYIATDLLAVTAMVVIAFYGDVAIRDHGIEASWAGAWTRAAAGTQFVLAMLIAFVGHRISPRRWLVFGTLAIAAGSLLAAYTEHPLMFAIVAGLSGAWLVIRMTCHAPQVLRLAPGRDGTTPIALAWTATGPVSGLAPFVSGWLMAEGVVGYRPIFIGVACLTLVSAALLFSRVPDEIAPADSTERTS